MLGIPALAGTPIETLEQSYADVRRFELDNGLVCLIKPDRSAPVVAVQVWVGTGAIHEGEYLGGGLSHYLEHMLFKGTSNRAPAEISQAIDNAGGEINAYTSYDRTVYHCVLPSDHWRTGVEVLADAVMNATFPEAEWLRERSVVQREVDMGRDDPDRLISKLLFRTAYRVHPYRHPIIGYEDVLTTMTRDELTAFYHQHYVPDNMIAVVAGDVDPAAVETFLRQTFDPFPRRRRAPVVIPEEPPQLSRRLSRQIAPFDQSRLAMTFHTVALSHPDTPALDVLAAVLGQGRSARLHQALVEEQQLASSIEAWSYTPKHPGFFAVEAVFEPRREQELISAIETELARVLEQPVTEAELAKARRQVLVGELRELQTVRGQASSIASGEFYAGDPALSLQYLRAVQEVTGETVQRVAAQYLQLDRVGIALLTPTPPETDAAAGPDATGADTAAVERVVLDSGLTLLVREDRRLPFVYVAAVGRGGLLSESAARNGVTHTMAEMLTRGTADLDAAEIAERVDSLGGTLSTFAGNNSFGLEAQCLSQDAATFLDLMGECLGASRFDDAELAKQKSLQLAELGRKFDNPIYLATRQLQEVLYPDHPYQWDALGSPQTIAAITRDAVTAHARRLVTTSNLVISVFGDIDLAEARRAVESAFARVPVGPRPSLTAAVPTPVLPQVAQRTEPRQQAILLLGYPGVRVDDPRADALDLLQNAMSGLSSDLVIEIRDRRGLVYYAGAFQRLGLAPGFFGLYAGTQAESIDEVRQILEQEVLRITTEGLRPEEFDRSRAQLIAAHEMDLQDNAKLAQVSALNELYGLGHAHAFQTRERLEKLDVETVRAAAQSVLQPERLAVSRVLPEAAAQDVPQR